MGKRARREEIQRAAASAATALGGARGNAVGKNSEHWEIPRRERDLGREIHQHRNENAVRGAGDSKLGTEILKEKNKGEEYTIGRSRASQSNCTEQN